MSLFELSALFVATAAAAAVNSAAGGGSVLSFPVAIWAGMSSIAASAANSVALAPGALASAWAYREELGRARRPALLLAGPALVGGAAGAVLLLRTRESTFDLVAPWLMLGATLLILGHDRFAAWLARHEGHSRRRALRRAAALLLALLVSLYGGYFGAGIGILMLSFFVLLGPMSIHEMNAAKSATTVLIKGGSSVYLLTSGVLDAAPVAVMTAGAVLGGWLGARHVRRLDEHKVRRGVVLVGLLLTALLGWTTFAR